MTPEAINVAIAEWLGWINLKRKDHRVLRPIGQHPSLTEGGEWASIPDFYHDLNAVAEAENRLRDDQLIDYDRIVNGVIRLGCRVSDFNNYPGDFIWHATAPQRCEALLRVIGRWCETPPQKAA